MSTDVVLTRTGILEIDNQHRQLISCLDELSQYVGSTFDYAASFNAVIHLLEYVRHHFAHEEKFLMEHGYPALQEHIAEHEKLSTEVDKLWQEVESGREIGEKVLGTVRNWILEHINAEDAEYAEFFAQHR